MTEGTAAVGRSRWPLEHHDNITLTHVSSLMCSLSLPSRYVNVPIARCECEHEHVHVQAWILGQVIAVLLVILVHLVILAA